MKKLEIIFGIIRIPLDFMVIIGALFLTYFIRPITDLIPGINIYFAPEKLPSLTYFSYFAFYSACFLILIFTFSGHYSLKTTYKRIHEFIKIILAASIWMMGIIAFYFLIIHQLFFSRLILGHSFLLVIIFVFIERLTLDTIQWWFLKKDYGRRRMVFIGITNESLKLWKSIKSDVRYKLIGIINSQKNTQPPPHIKILGQINNLAKIVQQHQINEVICVSNCLDETEIQLIIDFCQEEHIGYRFVPSLKNFNYAHIELDLIDGIPLISVKATPLEGWGRVLKRGFDVFCASLGLIVLSPLFLIIAILIKHDSKGPIFYKSTRVGYAGRKIFKMYKFRSMIQNAEDLKKNLTNQNERKGPLFKIKNDPRVTKLGNFLRRTSIDELPQLINVLKGEMSLVGPRAHLPDEVAKYEKHHKLVLGIKPGISGLSQINGRSDLEFEKEVKYDTFYIKNWTFLLDIKIIIKTIAVVFDGKGAD